MDWDLTACRSAWQNAATDTDKFASLFVIIKYLKSKDTTDVERKEVYRLIELSFLKRLLQSDVPPGCPPSIFKAVALSILACFNTEAELSADEEMHSLIPLLNAILQESITKPEDEQMITDAVCCLQAMSMHGNCNAVILETVFDNLVNLYCNGINGQIQALGLVVHMVIHNERTLTEANYQSLKVLIKTLAQQFNENESNKKFELCEIILYILLMQPSFQFCYTAAVDIREALKNILKSKIGKTHREVALKLAGLMVIKFGNHWFVEDAENSKEFFVVLIQITSVEVKVLLDDRSVYDIAGNAFLITACFKVLECVISTMVNENWFQSHQNCAEQLLNSLKMAMESVINFLKNTSTKIKKLNFKSIGTIAYERVTTEQILLATIRVLCAWLAEETFALQDEVREILPFILSLGEEWFKQCKAIDTDVDPLRFLLAPFCHLTADDASRKVLLDNNALTLILGYMECHWVHFEETYSSDSENVLTTICGILLNIVVLESHLVSENEEFFLLLKRLMNTLPNISSELKHLTLKGNFAVLGLFITKHCLKKIECCETSFYRFLSASIKFLWDAYQVEEENDEVKFIATRQYHEVWADVGELWFLGMQTLAVLVESMSWIASFLAESGWPVVIIDAFSTVCPSGIEGNIKYTYQALLCPLVKSSREITDALIQHHAVAVCQKHQLFELEGLLTKAAAMSL